jgi:serine/threonine protein kinase
MKTPYEIPNYDITGTLAQSHSCTIFSACNRATNTDVALKVVSRAHLSDPAVLAAFEQECRIHESLCHESIIRILEIVYKPAYVCVVMELGHNGDLLQWITTTPYRPSYVVISHFRKVLEAVQFVHSQGIAHLDLKPDNFILFGADCIKLTDFGCCESVETGRPIESNGTPAYAAPEILSGAKQDNRPADVWSLGIILCAMQTGQLPFVKAPDGLDPMKWLEDQISSGKLTLPLGIPECVRAIVRQCCQVDPAARPTVAELLCFPALRPANAARHAPCSSRHGIAGRRRLSARSIGRLLANQRWHADKCQGRAVVRGCNSTPRPLRCLRFPMEHL